MMEQTIMIVDDEAMVTTSLRSYLELETSYRVLTFSSGEAALEALAETPVHAIIADYMMPGLDGITFLRRARDTQPLATRILLTGYADRDNAIRAINEAGLYYYLEKPWDNAHLLLIVRNGVERTALFTEIDMRVSALESANRELHGLRQRLMQAFA